MRSLGKHAYTLYTYTTRRNSPKYIFYLFLPDHFSSLFFGFVMLIIVILKPGFCDGFYFYPIAMAFGYGVCFVFVVGTLTKICYVYILPIIIVFKMCLYKLIFATLTFSYMYMILHGLFW